NKRHGISIGIERIDDEFFLTFKATGKLTHEDYQKINPFIDSALEGVDHPSIKVLFDASELKGWELRAAWDDLKLGLKHGRQFTKAAVYGHKKWEEFAVKIGSWFFPGEYKYFEDFESAYDWLKEK
ncbi:MAG: STAS/SEC14 domain-containing protein, partial [Acidobacteria bacterium]|nr:STAS/SEC14 domain-containing protein [Acidobacteriota bacterium]